MSKKWTLNIGCHRNTHASRDSDTQEYDSLKECKNAVTETEKDLAERGYFIWCARAYGPDGEKVELHAGTPV